MFSLFPKNDSNQVVILRRFFIAGLSYLMVAGLGVFSMVSGSSSLDSQWVPLILASLFATNLVIYTMLRSGFNKRFKDPSLTFHQICVALVWVLLLMYTDGSNRGLFLSVYLMIMMFGVFRLRREELRGLAVFALLGYLIVVLADRTYFPQRFDLMQESLRFSVLAAMLVWVTFFVGHVSLLRTELRRRNRDLSAALDEIGKLATQDDLTKSFNRRYIMEALGREKLRADRTGVCLSLIIIDLDHFKAINDRYGHLSGDRVLMAFSERIRGTLRGMDLVDTVDRKRFFGRYGGEEFIVVLPDTPLAGALRCADRIRKVTEEDSFDDVFKVTISAGVSEYHNGESIEETLRRADAALYEAKNRGRNRVMAEDLSVANEYEIAVGENTVTNIVVGPFGKDRYKGSSD